MIETGCPVRILQGVQDPDVPWQHAVELTSSSRRTSRAHTGEGRRPPAVASRRHRAADRGGGGVLVSDSEVRIIARHARLRTSESKGH